MKQKKQSVNASVAELGKKVRLKRGSDGIRAAAKKIDISPATLSRIERGLMADVETLEKVCHWLGMDMSEVIGSRSTTTHAPLAAVHFRKDREIALPTAQALAELIIAAQKTVISTEATELR